MKKLLADILIALGIVFILVLIAGAYLYVADPYNLKPLIFGDATQPRAANEGAGGDAASPAVDPSQITPEQEACAVRILGQARVDEFKAGAQPTAAEYFQARECY